MIDDSVFEDFVCVYVCVGMCNFSFLFFIIIIKLRKSQKHLNNLVAML